MDKAPDQWSIPTTRALQKPRQNFLQNSNFFKVVFVITFALALFYFIISIYGLFAPANASKFYLIINPYIFVLLIPILFPGIPIIWVNYVMVPLYAIFFFTILYYGFKRWDGNLMDNPVIYYGGMASFALFLTLVITLIESAFGVAIGGTSISTDAVNYPYQTFVSLVYAPFAEELGFRIIPLGLLTVVLLLRVGASSGDSLKSFLVPGLIRKKYNLKFGRADYVMILATSALFGYAHIYFGAWDWGKFITAALVGVILAVGFLKFGVFVDIPIHWFFNGFLEISLVYPQAAGLTVLGFLWAMFSGLVGLIFIIIFFTERREARQLSQANSP